MKQSNLSLDNLLNELSEEKINLVVDNNIVAGWSSCGSHKSSKSHKSKSCKTKKSGKSH